MGILSDLFGFSKNQLQVPILTSIVPVNAVQAIKTGQLPKFNTKTIMLGNNEVCHFIDRAALITQRKKKKYESRRTGGSYRIMKGVTIYSGKGTTTPVEETETEYTQGLIYVTDSRIIFVAQEKAFEKKIKNLTAVVPYTDAVSLQYGSETYNLMIPQADLLANVIQLLYKV